MAEERAELRAARVSAICDNARTQRPTARTNASAAGNSTQKAQKDALWTIRARDRVPTLTCRGAMFKVLRPYEGSYAPGLLMVQQVTQKADEAGG